MITQAEYKIRRQKLSEFIKEGVLILPGNISYIRNHDVEFDFRQNSDFWYLTGFNEPNTIMVLTFNPSIEYILFVEPYDVNYHIWLGERTGIEGAINNFKADKAYPINEINNILPEIIAEFSNIYYRNGTNFNVDSIINKYSNSNLRSVTGTRGNYNLRKKDVIESTHIIDPIPFISQLRLYKSDNEIELIKNAINISKTGFEHTLNILKPGINEYEIQTELEYQFRKNGSRYNAYPAIIASGENACVLHYINNNSFLNDDEFILIDAGAEYENYASDITRTYMISNNINSLKKMIYDIVFDAQQKAINSVKPNTTLSKIHKIALEVLVQGLKDIKILKGSKDEIIERNLYKEFYMHGTSHWLGLDVHDTCPYTLNQKDILLEPGMIFTVEPGLYFTNRSRYSDKNQILSGTGVRIEDDILVTENGHINLSSDISYR
jgi:Xaa-Pro aminopeptidase